MSAPPMKGIWLSACPGGCGFMWHSPAWGEVEMVMGSHTRGCLMSWQVNTDVEYFNEHTREWGFKDQHPRFKWAPGSKIVFVFAAKGSTAAFALFHIKKEDPEIEEVQEEAREWLKKWKEGYDIYEISEMRGTKPMPPKPPDGPHCRACFKADDGSLIPDPKDAAKEICMMCFIGESR